METSLCAILLLASLASLAMLSSATYVVETSIIVDEGAVKLWKRLTGKEPKPDIETEIQAMMREVNLIYQGLDSVDVRFVIKEIEFITGPVTSPSVDGEIDADVGLAQFTNWLNILERKNNDLTLLLTGAKLTFPLPAAPLGIANIGTICKGTRSVAMIHFKPTMQGAVVMAHEIGHVLGSRHDADGNNCDPKQQYLMIYSDLLTGHRYKFSSCSERYIQETLYRLEANNENCLRDHQGDKPPAVPQFGALITGDTVCRRQFGSRAYVDRKVYSDGYGDNVCLKLACYWVHWRTKKAKTQYIPSPDGLHCGKNKACLKGKCVVTPKGLASVSDTCPFGDQPALHAASSPKACGLISSSDCHKYKDVCCKTCDETNPEFGNTGDDACRKLEGPYSQMVRGYNATTYPTICSEMKCLKKIPLIKNKFQSNTYKAPNGMACGKVSYETYRSIFNGSFNIGFGYPRKDTCSKCDSFISRLAHIDNQLTQTTLTETEKLDLNREKATIGTEKELHHRKSETFYSRKTDAKARAKTCDEFEAITFDFAKNLPVPNKTCNDVYYKRQLSLYTFNIHVLSTDDVFLYTYDETVAKKGSDDVASMLMDFFINKLSNDVREVSLFCDGCSGQNKNYTIIRLLHHLVHHVKRFRSVKLSFPIRGHSYLECDRDFANVNFKKDLELPDEWRKEFVETRKKPSPFNVINATQGMFYSYAEFLFPFYKPTNPIKVRAVREFFFADTEPSLSHLVKHRDTWNGGYSSTSIVKIQRGNRASTRPSPAPRTSYSAPLPITLGKYKDLQILKEQCRPSNHAFFDDLPHHGQSTAVSTFVRDSDDDTPLVSDDESDD